MALSLPEMCFWPAKTRKNLEIFEMHTYHWPGAQIWFRYNWKKLFTASLLLNCIDWYGCFRCWNQFFQLFFGFWIEGFSYCFKTETFAIGFQKWFGHEWIDYGFFLLENGFFRWPAICQDWNLHELLICYSFLTTSFFSMFSLRGILVCSLKKLVLFSHRNF